LGLPGSIALKPKPRADLSGVADADEVRDGFADALNHGCIQSSRRRHDQTLIDREEFARSGIASQTQTSGSEVRIVMTMASGSP